MTARSAQHASFTIDRTFDAPVARVYAAFSSEEGKSRWFSGPNEKWERVRRTFDFRVGGREHLSGRWRAGMAPRVDFSVSSFDACYFDILPEQRIVYAYDMHLDERHISVSLATLEFSAAGTRTQLKLTEQGVFLDGYDDAGSRERGMRELMDKLAASLVDH